MDMKFNRRSFLKGAAGAAAAAAAGGCCTGGIRCARKFSGDKIRFGVIGAGGKGLSDWKSMVEHGETIAAFCDVDSELIETALAEYKKMGGDPSQVKVFKDYREMLEKMDGCLDAVTVSTPDHMHAAQAIAAMKLGLPVYVQKPLVRTLWEAKQFERVAKAAGVVTQMGNQGSALPGMRYNVDLISQGIIGDVKEVHVWTNRPIWPQGCSAVKIANGPADAIPANLDWDLWLGVAPKRPFRGARPKDMTPPAGTSSWWGGEQAYHKFNWRAFTDFGTGAFGDMACHTFNMPFRALELGKPVGAECVRIDEKVEGAYPLRSIVEVVYAARESRVRKGHMLPEAKMVWYDGNILPPADLMPQCVATFGKVPETGCLMIGTEGIIVSTNDYGAAAYIALKGENKMKSTEKHEACKAMKTSTPLRKDKNHYVEFCDAIRGIGPVYEATHSRCYADIEHSVPMLEGMLVGCIAQQVSGALKWDSGSQTFIGSKAANDLVKPYVRSGWQIA